MLRVCSLTYSVCWWCVRACGARRFRRRSLSRKNARRPRQRCLSALPHTAMRHVPRTMALGGRSATIVTCGYVPNAVASGFSRNTKNRATCAQTSRKFAYISTYIGRSHRGGSNGTIRMEIGHGLATLPRLARDTWHYMGFGPLYGF